MCRGYAVVLKKLLNELGVESRILSGTGVLENGERGGHAWNQVKIDGKWYNLDLTWDAYNIKKGSQLEYFLMDDETFGKDHINSKLGVDIVVEDFIQDDGTISPYFYEPNKLGDGIHECNETYDRIKVNDYFSGEQHGIEQSQGMIAQAIDVENISSIDINHAMAAIIDTEKEKSQEGQDRIT